MFGDRNPDRFGMEEPNHMNEPVELSIQHETVQEVLKQKFIESSLPGLPQIIKAQKVYQKIWWIFAWFFGTALCVYFVTDSTLVYFKYDVVSKSRIYDTFSMKFPKITLCNLDPFTTNASVEFLADFIKENKMDANFEFENNLEMVSGTLTCFM